MNLLLQWLGATTLVFVLVVAWIGIQRVARRRAEADPAGGGSADGCGGCGGGCGRRDAPPMP